MLRRVGGKWKVERGPQLARGGKYEGINGEENKDGEKRGRTGWVGVRSIESLRKFMPCVHAAMHCMSTWCMVHQLELDAKRRFIIEIRSISNSISSIYRRSKMESKPTIMVLCTGNSCRSHMVRPSSFALPISLCT